MNVKAGFQRSRNEQSRKRDASAGSAARPAEYELMRFGSPVKDLGADRSAYAEEIARLWSEAQDRFLKIGRYLVRAKERLPHGAFDAMVADELPFGRHVAWQLRTVALAVDGGRLDEDRLPNSYSTAFKLATLDDDLLEMAKRENVVRPNVTRSEVAQFVLRVSNARRGQSSTRVRLIEERADLTKRIRALNAELAEAQTRLTEVNKELESSVD